MAREDLTQAAGVSVVTDEVGSVWIRLHDKTGAVYSYACVPPTKAQDLADVVANCVTASAVIFGQSLPTIQ
ncbi:hypothetical protein [Caulobacter sp. 1776]|uniref:hypothetical protein n=1 Tax=Caulobacter sp. 1776 TaxID=3156420 RepID=UPI00339588D0